MTDTQEIGLNIARNLLVLKWQSASINPKPWDHNFMTKRNPDTEMVPSLVLAINAIDSVLKGE